MPDGSTVDKITSLHCKNINGESGVDFNSFTKQGIYIRGYTSWACSNTPWNDIYCAIGGFVLLVGETDSSIIQLCFWDNYGGYHYAIRYYLNSNWGTWKSVG